MTYFIDDYNEYQIYITDLWREYYIPKFDELYLTVEEPELVIEWTNLAKGGGGERRILRIDYRDVVDGYSGYASNPSSAQDLKDMIDAMRVSAFPAGGDLLTAKADLLSHDGVSDTILPGGANESVLIRDNAQSTGLNWVAKSNIVAGGLSVTDTSTIDLTLAGASLSGRSLFETMSYSQTPFSPTDGSTIFWGHAAFPNGVAALRNAIRPQVATTLISVICFMQSTSTIGSNENISLYVRVNDTTDYLVATVGTTDGTRVFYNGAMNGGAGIAFNGTTDYFIYKIVFPVFAANPTSCGFSGTENYKLT